MPKKNTKGGTKARKTTRAKGNKGRQSMAMSSGSNVALMRQVCSITDPFCNAAIGSKYPDSSSLKTLAWSSRQFVTITTDASGRGAVFFGVDPGYAVASVATWTGATMAVLTLNAPTAIAGWSNWAAVTGVQYRNVSYGVQARSILPMMTNQGSLGILAIPASSSAISTIGIDMDATNYSANLRGSMNDSRGLVALSNSDGVNSKMFKYASSPGANSFNSVGNDILVVYITGGPASTASVQVEIASHYELTFASNTVFNTIATPSAIENDTVQTGSNYVKRTVDQVMVGGAKEVERRVMGAAEVFGRFLVRKAAGAIGSYIGGPVGGKAASSAAGMIMDVD